MCSANFYSAAEPGVVLHSVLVQAMVAECLRSVRTTMPHFHPGPHLGLRGVVSAICKVQQGATKSVCHSQLVKHGSLVSGLELQTMMLYLQLWCIACKVCSTVICIMQMLAFQNEVYWQTVHILWNIMAFSLLLTLVILILGSKPPIWPSFCG